MDDEVPEDPQVVVDPVTGIELQIRRPPRRRNQLADMIEALGRVAPGQWALVQKAGNVHSAASQISKLRTRAREAQEGDPFYGAVFEREGSEVLAIVHRNDPAADNEDTGRE